MILCWANTKRQLLACIPKRNSDRFPHIFHTQKGGCHETRFFTKTIYTKMDGLLGGTQYFPPKVNNFHECPITVRTFEHNDGMEFFRHANGTIIGIGGLDGDILSILAKNFNFKINLRVISNEDRRMDRPIRNLSINRELAIGMLIMQQHRYSDFDYSVSYNSLSSEEKL